MTHRPSGTSAGTRRRAGLIALLVLAGGWDILRAPDPDVDKGNQAYQEGRYQEALGHYRSAESRGTDARLHFDMGAALYKLGEQAADEEKAKLLQQAEEQFRRAADTDDAGLKSSAYYNLGNAMYQRQQWEDAISAYKRALRADPNNQSARHNLEMALRQRPKQDQQQQGGQQQGQQGQRDPQQGQQGQPGQQQGQQGQQPGQQGQQDKQNEPDQAPQGGGQGEPDQPDAQRGQPRAQDPGQQDRQREEERARQRQQQGPEPDEAKPPSDGAASDSDRPTDQQRKLDELERRSRDLRKRLLRQGGKSRDPMRLPSRKDW